MLATSRGSALEWAEYTWTDSVCDVRQSGVFDDTGGDAYCFLIDDTAAPSTWKEYIQSGDELSLDQLVFFDETFFQISASEKSRRHQPTTRKGRLSVPFFLRGERASTTRMRVLDCVLFTYRCTHIEERHSPQSCQRKWWAARKMWWVWLNRKTEWNREAGLLKSNIDFFCSEKKGTERTRPFRRKRLLLGLVQLRWRRHHQQRGKVSRINFASRRAVTVHAQAQSDLVRLPPLLLSRSLLPPSPTRPPLFVTRTIHLHHPPWRMTNGGRWHLAKVVGVGIQQGQVFRQMRCLRRKSRTVTWSCLVNLHGFSFRTITRASAEKSTVSACSCGWRAVWGRLSGVVRPKTERGKTYA